MTRLAVAIAMLLAVACKKKLDEVPLPVSPATQGLCQSLVISTTSGHITAQRCAWQSYWWTCDTAFCTRGERIDPERVP